MESMSKRPRIGCAAIVFAALLFLVLCALFIKYATLVVHVAFADEQTEIFEDMRERAFKSAGPTEAVGYLEYTINYYPSGTKQENDSRLDRIVERTRRSIVREIIIHLREQTREDLGNDPQVWIDRFKEGG
jgi:hypothetical protein